MLFPFCHSKVKNCWSQLLQLTSSNKTSMSPRLCGCIWSLPFERIVLEHPAFQHEQHLWLTSWSSTPVSQTLDAWCYFLAFRFPFCADLQFKTFDFDWPAYLKIQCFLHLDFELICFCFFLTAATVVMGFNFTTQGTYARRVREQKRRFTLSGCIMCEKLKWKKWQFNHGMQILCKSFDRKQFLDKASQLQKSFLKWTLYLELVRLAEN